MKFTPKSEQSPNHQLPVNLPDIRQEIQTRTFPCFWRGVGFTFLHFALFSLRTVRGNEHWNQMEGIKLEINGTEPNTGLELKQILAVIGILGFPACN